MLPKLSDLMVTDFLTVLLGLALTVLLGLALTE